MKALFVKHWHGMATLLDNPQHLAIIQDDGLSDQEKANKIPPEDVSYILSCCEGARWSLDDMAAILGRLLQERSNIPCSAKIVNDDEMMEFAGAVSMLAGEMGNCLTSIQQNAASIAECQDNQ